MQCDCGQRIWGDAILCCDCLEDHARAMRWATAPAKYHGSSESSAPRRSMSSHNKGWTKLPLMYLKKPKEKRR